MSSIRSILERCSVGIGGFVNIDGKVEDGIEVEQALKDISELIDGAIMPAISVNQKGQFEDDGGNICWYLDDLEKALRNNLKELLK